MFIKGAGVETLLDLTAFVLKCHLLILSYSCTNALHSVLPGQKN